MIRAGMAPAGMLRMVRPDGTEWSVPGPAGPRRARARRGTIRADRRAQDDQRDDRRRRL